jgi:NADH-quinone oxidoreductase subunit N
LTDGLTIEALRPIGPVLTLVVTMGAVLVGAMVGRDGSPRRGLVWVTLAGLAAALLFAVRLFSSAQPLSGTWLSDFLVLDRLYLFVTIFLCGVLMGVLLLSASLWRKPAWEWPIFLCMLLASLIGMILLASSRHLLVFVIAFELASLPSYVLVGFRRFNTKSAEGAAKILIFGAVCSAIMIYGLSLLYGLTGSLDWPQVAEHLAKAGLSPLTIVALVCLFTGVAFKISLVPAHFWCPDAYEAAGADVAAWLSVASKAAALFALARFLRALLPSLTPAVQDHVLWVLAAVAVVTMTVANLSAFWQTSVKRLLAYSSIAHAGYITCGVLIFSDATGTAAIVAYVLIYLLMNLGAFAVAGLIEGQSGSDHLDRFTGLAQRNPGLAAALAVLLFSLVGLPPLAGFAAKWILLSVLWQHQLAWVVVAVLANTVFSLFYYLRITREMYFNRSDLAPVKVPGLTGLVVATCSIGLIVLFMGWGLVNGLGLWLVGSVR